MEPSEAPVLEKVWEQTVVQAQWNLGHQTAPELTFEAFRKALVDEFGGLLPGGKEHASNLRQMKDEIKALVQLVDGWVDRTARHHGVPPPRPNLCPPPPTTTTTTTTTTTPPHQMGRADVGRDASATAPCHAQHARGQL